MTQPGRGAPRPARRERGDGPDGSGSGRQGSIGAVADDIAVLEPWGFSAADVTQDVGVWLGSENSECRSAADYFATTIPRATYVIFPGEGHLVPLPRWAEMLAWLH